MLGYGCDVYQYPQFYVKYLDMYQVLPRPYLGSFDVCTGDKLIKKWVLDLSSQAETFFWECIESRMTIDYIEKGKKSILDNFERKTREGKINTTISM